ncbi:MAG: hypothetical protein MI747_03720 [Desulfobacterales bacterium]|nr:hypothetical protein [Desulfobacterales bacterium]
MKTIKVTITAEFSVPDNWEVVDHVSDPDFPDEAVRVLKIDEEYYDFFPECLKKVDDQDRVIWSAGEGRAEDLIDCLDGFQVRIQEND